MDAESIRQKHMTSKQAREQQENSSLVKGYYRSGESACSIGEGIDADLLASDMRRGTAMQEPGARATDRCEKMAGLWGCHTAVIQLLPRVQCR